jgi:hypothetical protein
MNTKEGLLEQSGALEAEDKLQEDPCVHVLAPYNVPMRIHHGVDGSVIGIAGGLRLGGPAGGSLRMAHQYAAQHDDVCLAGLLSALASTTLMKQNP